MIASALKVLGGISIGVGIGQQWARAELDRFYRKKGEEFVSQQYRIMYESFQVSNPEAPVDHEHLLDEIDPDHNKIAMPDMDGPDTGPDVINVGGEALLVEAKTGQPTEGYSDQVSVYQSSAPETAISYISEDEYNEEDGNSKEQITIFLQAGNEEPLFVQGGDPITDWQRLIGDTILVDFFRKFQPNETERVLYVRNHERGEDYEVFQAMG